MIFKIKVPSADLDRIDDLIQSKILDIELEEGYTILAKFITHFMNAPMGGVSLLNEQKTWFIRKKGFKWEDNSKDNSFSSQALLNPEEILIVKDATLDERFAKNPYVNGDSKVRFFIAVPLVSNKKPIGTLCVADSIPRKAPNPYQISLLKSMGKLAVAQYEFREFVINIYKNIQELQKFPINDAHEAELLGLYKKADFILEKIKNRRASN